MSDRSITLITALPILSSQLWDQGQPSPSQPPLDKAGLCFMCWIEGGPNRIWKQRWDNGAAQAYSGFAGYTVPWREVVGAGGEGERPEAIGVFQEFPEKKGIPVLANC